MDFNEFFQFIDRTTSAIGQQYLYHQLRTLNALAQPLEELEKGIEDYAGEEGKRVALQKTLITLSNRNDYYFPFLIYGQLPPKINFLWFVKLLQGLACIGIAAMFFFPIVFIPLIFVFATNLFLHYWHKKRIGNFAVIFSRIGQLTKACRSLLQHTGHSKAEKTVLISKVKNLEQITSKILLLKTDNWQGNEAAAVFWYATELLKIATVSEITTFHSIVDKIETSRKDIKYLFEFIAAVDVAISIGSLRASLPHYSLPQFTPRKKEIAFEGLFHPLVKDCVDNELHLQQKSLLLTGSNMSGKSTFIKAINLNVIASQVLNTSFTHSYQAPLLALATSIHISDDLTENTSYYMAEVDSIGKLISLSRNKEVQFLFTIDEVFKGTNTIERISSAKAILEYLNKESEHIVLVSTHDIELTQLLQSQYELHYFQESIENKALSFDYKLRQGALKKRNAINILEMAAYPQEIIAEAKKLANQFEKEKTGN